MSHKSPPRLYPNPTGFNTLMEPGWSIDEINEKTISFNTILSCKNLVHCTVCLTGVESNFASVKFNLSTDDKLKYYNEYRNGIKHGFDLVRLIKPG